MYSTIDFTGHFNSSRTITQLAIVEKSPKWTDEEIARLIHIIFRPILFIFGTAGNFLSFYMIQVSRNSIELFTKRQYLHRCKYELKGCFSICVSNKIHIYMTQN